MPPMNKTAMFLSGYRVQSNGRLVQKQDAGAVKQGRGNLTAHALSRRKLPCRGPEEIQEISGKSGAEIPGAHEKKEEETICVYTELLQNIDTVTAASWKRFRRQ